MYFCRVEEDLNGVMPRKSAGLAKLPGSAYHRISHVYFCRVEEDLNGVMPRKSAGLAKLPGSACIFLQGGRGSERCDAAQLCRTG